MEFQNSNQLKGYIQNERKQKNMGSDYAYKYYFFRNFLERIFSADMEKFVLKGSFSQFATLKQFTRPLTDIDIVTFGSVESAANTIENVLLRNDGIKFNIKQKFVTTNATINYRILCNFDNISHLITIDLKKDKVFDSQTTDLPTLFSKDRKFDVNASSLEEHLAKKIYIAFLNYKLHTMLGKEFRRFKDFFDIYSILSKGNFDLLKVIELIKQNFKEDEFLRDYDLKGSLIDSSFVQNNREKWISDAKKYEFNKDVTFESAVDVTNEFLSRGL